MTQEKSKKSGKHSDQETMDSLAASLKGEVRRGLSLLDQCVNNIAQAKWILISVESSVDQFQTVCSSCKNQLLAVKKSQTTENAKMNIAKLESSTTKSQTTPATSKDANAFDAEKQKIAPTVRTPPSQRFVKEKPVVSEKKPSSKPTAKRTGGAPGRQHQITKKLTQLDKILKKAKLTKVSLQCVAALMRGKRTIDIKKIPKRDPKFKLNLPLNVEKKQSSTKHVHGSLTKHSSVSDHAHHKQHHSKISTHVHDREIEKKIKNIKTDKPTYTSNESHSEKKRQEESHKPRKDSVDSAKVLKRQRSSSSSSSGSCSTCSSSTIDAAKPSKERVAPEKLPVPKKVKILTMSDDENDKKSSHKIKVSRGTFSVIKSKAAVKYHEDTKVTDKVRPKVIDQNGSVGEKLEHKSKEIKSDSKSDHKTKSNKSEDKFEHKFKEKKSENSEPKSKIKSVEKVKKSGHDSVFDKLIKEQQKPSEKSREMESKELGASVPKRVKHDDAQSDHSGTSKGTDTSGVMRGKQNVTQFDLSEDSKGAETTGCDNARRNETQPDLSKNLKNKTAEAASVDSVEAPVVDPQTESKFQSFLKNMKSKSGGKSELKYQQKNPLVIQAKKRGITSIDSPEFKVLVLDLFEGHKAKAGQKISQGSESSRESRDGQEASTKVVEEKEGQGKEDSDRNNLNETDTSHKEDQRQEDAEGCAEESDTTEVKMKTVEHEQKGEGNIGVTKFEDDESDENKQSVADHYAKFQQKKAEEMKALKMEARKVFASGNSKDASSVNSDDRMATNNEAMEPTMEDESIELGEDVIGSCLDVITSVSAAQPEPEAPSTMVKLMENENGDHVSIASGKEIQEAVEVAHTPILTLQDTVSPTAMEKFFSNETAEN